VRFVRESGQGSQNVARQTSQEKVFDRLAVLPSQASRIKYVQRLRLMTPSTVEQLDEAVRQQLRVDLNKANGLAEAAVAIANELGHSQSTAYAQRAKANALCSRGHNHEAAELLSQAVTLFEEAGNRLETGRTLSTSIQPLILLGEYDRAHDAARKAQKIFADAGDEVRLARLEINIGNIFHRQDRFREALEHYQRAHSRLLSTKDAEGIIAALHNIAMCMSMLNEPEEALKAYEQVREFCQEREMPLAIAQADYNIAYLFYLRGRYVHAVDMLRDARRAAVKAGDGHRAALCLLDLSEIYLELNLHQEAAELAQEAYAAFEELGMRYEAAKALCHLAIAQSQDRGFRALVSFARARAMFVSEKNLVWPSLIDFYVALAYFNDGRLEESRLHCCSALVFFRDSPLKGKAALCRLLLAKLSLKAGDIPGALEECRTAGADLEGHETPILIYELQLVLGQIEQAAGNLQEAEKHYLRAKEVLERLRGGLYGDQLKISFLENRLALYEGLVDLHLVRGTSPEACEKAWNCMEQAKSRTLLELMISRAHEDTREAKSATPRIAKVREQLNWYYHRIEIEHFAEQPARSERLSSLWRLAAQSETELLHLIRELPAEQAAAEGSTAAHVSLAVLRESLGPDTTLVEYFQVRDRILATIITPNSIDVVAVTSGARVAKVLGMLQYQLAKFRLGPGYVKRFHSLLLETAQAHLHDLYKELISPIRHRLEGKHLVVVPHESLHYAPFHALFDGNQYLVDSFTVSYAPSASIYVQCRQKSANPDGTSLVLGVPNPQAPSIDDELRWTKTLLPNAKLFAGAEASEKVLRREGPRSSLIHIASHGFFRPDRPMFSGIWLGDTFLTLYDLYQLRLPADLITLSGCSTGMNAVAAGDELIGLTRGLLFAGARTLLLSLWDVNDRSTQEIMKSFYQRFFKEPNHAFALQGAMMDLRKEYPHPYYWAPFILLGNVFSGDGQPGTGNRASS